MNKKMIEDLMGQIERGIKKDTPSKPFCGTADVDRWIEARRVEPKRRVESAPSGPVAASYEQQCRRFGCRLAKVQYSRYCDKHTDEIEAED